MRKTAKRRPPVHPGEILREEFMKDRDLSAYALSKGLGVPAPRVNDLVNEKRGLSPDTARRLATYFGNSVEFWMGLQADYEIELERDKCSDEELHAIVNAPSG